MEQRNIFQGTVYGVTIGAGNQQPPRNVHCTTVISEENESWCTTVANAISDATGNFKYGRSTVINEAVSFYRNFYKYRHKLLHKKKAVLQILDSF